MKNEDCMKYFGKLTTSIILFLMLLSFFFFFGEFVFSSERAPEFQNHPVDDYDKPTHRNILKSFSKTSTSDANITERNSFDSCVIYIVDSIFCFCKAYGPSYNLGSGGAIFAMNSQLSLTSTSNQYRMNFANNEALAGGAISLINSDLYANGCDAWLIHFDNNKAVYMGGALLCLNNQYNINSDEKHFCQITFTEFYNNSANEICGAACIYGISDSWFDHCLVRQNHATYSSGAIGFYQCQGMFMFACTLFSNTVGNRTFFGNNGVFTMNQNKAFRKFDNEFGGGAVFVRVLINEKEGIVSDDYRTNIIFATEHCIFLNNTCRYKKGLEPEKNGFDIYFSGDITFQSFEDRFATPRNISMGGNISSTMYFGTKYLEGDSWNSFVKDNEKARYFKWNDFGNGVNPLFGELYEYAQNVNHHWDPTNPFEHNTDFEEINLEFDNQQNDEEPVNTHVATKLPERTTRSAIPNPTNIDENHKVTSMTRTIPLSYSPSSQFSKSSHFSQSSFFSESGVFSETNGFSMTNDFSSSSVFSSSSDFTISSEFSFSSDFSSSEGFSSSVAFSKSEDFSYSKQFSRTDVFSKSNIFESTDGFSKSAEFSRSNVFKPSDQFSASEVL
ncbi:hypothetical protein TRFO_26862 [Tritrichomonas foetus]|uniref:Uncharacterized protein n=1 Tax=Tritrichomonas foetus TaxID=1144522 RepID=A0A1J4K224_9EUKA|nr:hypothetical protein TRFO_26862 [Tritrichomonas foetus]|eukprot:OHT05439.1 hypothetical protein TRFO_26862 [Tritrichomonas foetus]